MKTNTKRLLIIGILTLSLAVFAGCTANTPTATQTPTATEAPTPTATETFAPADTEAATSADVANVAAEDTLKTFTVEELALFDGKNGNLAYVAVEGIVYDVSDVPQWSGGIHDSGRLQAGMDQTEAITTRSPHGLRVLEDLPIVGTLVE